MVLCGFLWGFDGDGDVVGSSVVLWGLFMGGVGGIKWGTL